MVGGCSLLVTPNTELGTMLYVVYIEEKQLDISAVFPRIYDTASLSS